MNKRVGHRDTPLTGQQIEILKLYDEGKVTRHQVARTLGISKGSLDSKLELIVGKLYAYDIKSAYEKARDLGLLDEGNPES